jgi:hypothetical protein
LQDFLQGVFETENEVARKITGIETKGEKRTSLEEEPCISTKKYKLSSCDHTSSQFENSVPFEGRSKVSINNIDNNDTETSEKLSSVHEVSNFNLSASKTKVQLLRNDRCKQSGLRMQLDDTCPTLSDNCPDRRTPVMFEPRIHMLSDERYKQCENSTFKGKITFMRVLEMYDN